MPDTNQPPFMPPKFAGGPPTPIAGVWEDGPGLFTNPANSSTAVRYTGQSQTFYINTGKPPLGPADWESGPNVIDKAGNIGLIVSTPTAKPGSQGPMPGPMQSPQSGPGLMTYLGSDGKVYAYDSASDISYPLT
jgi:hypothetical protein